MRSLRSRAAKRRIRQLQSHQTLAIQSDIINPVNPIRSHQLHQILSVPSNLINPIRSYLPILSQPTSSKAADKTRTAPIRYYLPHQTLAILSDLISSMAPHQILSTPSTPSDLINFIRYYLPHQTSSDITNSSSL